MKKSVLLGLATLALAATATTASAQEVTYVPDCSQGLLLNRNADNWFLTLQGGSNIMFGKHDIKADLKNRFGGNAGLFVGKWISPVFGIRFGGVFEMVKGATTADGVFRNISQGAINDAKTYYPEKWLGVGPEFDAMVNLTNWWCGYRPGRVYNAVVHGGVNALFRWDRNKSVSDWKYAHDTNLSVNLGLQNNFRLSDVVSLFLDVQYEMWDFKNASKQGDLSASLGFTFNLGKSDWNCPVTAVCPTWKYTDAEGDALVAKLNAAENKIADLQNQLDACMRKPKPTVTRTDCEGICTVYFPINDATLSSREKTILKSMAAVMQETGKTYQLTGWADNYTGNDEINTALRNRRVDNVKNFLVNCGVSDSQLKAGIDNGNLTDFGAKGAPLDRAVTIRLAD